MLTFGKDISEELKYYLTDTQDVDNRVVSNIDNRVVSNIDNRVVSNILTDIISKLLNSSQGHIINNKMCVPYHYSYLTKNTDDIKSYPSFSQALNIYLKPSLPKPVTKLTTNNKKETNLDTLTKKTNTIKYSNAKLLDGLTKKIKRLDKQINLVLENRDTIEQGLTTYQGNLSKTRGSDHQVDIAVGDNIVILCASKSYYENITDLYSKLKKLKDRVTKVTDGLQRALENVSKNDPVNKSGTKPNAIPKIELVNNKWYQEYYWFITKNGFLVICGKNSTQNETIVKRMMETHDIYLHSEVPGSGSAILKNPDKRDISIVDYEQAGAFVICHSNAWKANVSDRAYWVTPDQVSKTTNTGEYITKGSFIIRGHRNFLSIPDLVLGIVIKDGQLMIAPYSCVNQYDKRLKCIPGKQKRNQLLQKILTHFNIIGSEKSNIDLQVPHYLKNIG